MVVSAKEQDLSEEQITGKRRSQNNAVLDRNKQKEASSPNN